jgi:phosphoribosylaminoimidazolecarboxamide formyltransferase/IMP cyclohydrolase
LTFQTVPRKSPAVRVRRALLSVSDRRGLVDLGRALAGAGVEILATGGTAEALRGAGLPAIPVSEYTGSPEILGGRVKTLHPHIHAGILARDCETDRADLARAGIGTIDLVVVNLYPFVATVARPDVTLPEAIEQIDIGGPTMIRAAAKNWQRVAVVVDPGDYPDVIATLGRAEGLDEGRRYDLAHKAFAHTAAYDAAISNWLGARSPEGPVEGFPRTLTLQFARHQAMRYGENPHQRAALYGEDPAPPASLPAARQFQGKELSYNNVLDLDAALALALDFVAPAAVIVKHGNPCGAAVGPDPAEALRRARAADPVSAFGGIVAFNRPVTGSVADEIRETFFEAVVAPAFDAEARDRLASKGKLRLLETGSVERIARGLALRGVFGGLLVQTRDGGSSVRAGRVVTRRAPSDPEWAALEFAWTVVRHVRSNAIVLARDDRTVGVGAGQMSRLDSVRLAVDKAQAAAAGAVLASDAFFPFRDGLDAAAAAGVTAVAQPGGSVRDAEVVEAADEAGIAMVATGVRHFSH